MNASSELAHLSMEFREEEWGLVTQAARLMGQTPEEFILDASLRAAEAVGVKRAAATLNLPGQGGRPRIPHQAAMTSPAVDSPRAPGALGPLACW